MNWLIIALLLLFVIGFVAVPPVIYWYLNSYGRGEGRK